MKLSRRTFVLSSGLAVAPLACRARHQAAEVPPGPGTVAPAVADKAPEGHETIAAAESVVGVEYSPEERAMIAQSLPEQLDMVAQRRSVELGWDLSPALQFDPGFAGAEAAPIPGRVRHTRKRTPVPKSEQDIAFASVAEQAAWLRSGSLKSTTLTEIYLTRLESYGPALECVITRIDEQQALAEAAAADRELARGAVRSPIHGIPYGLKDLFDTRGIATTWGAKPFADRVPSSDAVVVQRLRQAGAILVAKLSLGALAYGDIWFGGRTRNPWNTEEGSSGSSAGSASATAAALVGFALGTETWGSIVSPSNRCGTVGLRPTFGRVARTGAMPLCWSLDKVGVLSRAVEDSAMVLGAIHGADPGDPSSVTRPLGFDERRRLRGRRIGFSPAWFEGERATAADRRALDVLRGSGATLVEVELPKLPYHGLVPILLAEAAAAFEDLTRSNRDDLLTWQDQAAWPNTFRTARFLTAVDIIQADRFRRMVMGAIDKLFATVDLLISPPNSQLLLATNFTGHPSLTVRAGFVDRRTRTGHSDHEESSAGQPVRVPRCVTLWGRLYDEATLLEVGHALEGELDVWRERPPSVTS